MECRGLFCRTTLCASSPVLHTAGQQRNLAAQEAVFHQLGRAKPVTRPPSRILRTRPNGRFQSHQAERLRQDYVAILITAEKLESYEQNAMGSAESGRRDSPGTSSPPADSAGRRRSFRRAAHSPALAAFRRKPALRANIRLRRLFCFILRNLLTGHQKPSRVPTARSRIARSERIRSMARWTPA